MARLRIFRILLFSIAGLIAATSAHAHADLPPGPHDIWTTWTLDPWVVVPLSIFVTVYFGGAVRLWSRSRVRNGRPWRHVSFAFGILALLLALVSPLDGLGESLFSAHMAQHMVLMVLAAPLLVLAQPLPVLLHGLPPYLRRLLVATRWGTVLLRSITKTAQRPFLWTVVQIMVLAAWHAPAFFIAAQTNDAVHTAMHLSFLFSAVMFWWSVAGAAVKSGSAALIAAFAPIVTMKFSGLLGILILFAPDPIYPGLYAETATAWSTTAIRDQQLAALVMLVPGATVYFITSVAILSVWLFKLESRTIP